MNKVRLTFSKTGNGVYISHLDLLRVFTRALRRTGIPVAYSAGFNPHMQLVFSMPLSLGTASLCEFLEFPLTEEIGYDVLMQRLNAVLPSFIRVVAVGEASPALSLVYASEYKITLSGSLPPAQMADKIRSLLTGPELVVEKKSKRALREVDILPFILEWSIANEEDQLVLQAKVYSNSEQNLNPNVLISAIQRHRPDLQVCADSILKTNVFFQEVRDMTGEE